jgi:hypothetical protein
MEAETMFDWITANDAAIIIGCNPHWVRNLGGRGVITRKQTLSGEFMYNTESVNNYVTDRDNGIRNVSKGTVERNPSEWLSTKDALALWGHSSSSFYRRVQIATIRVMITNEDKRVYNASDINSERKHMKRYTVTPVATDDKNVDRYVSRFLNWIEDGETNGFFRTYSNIVTN